MHVLPPYQFDETGLSRFSIRSAAIGASSAGFAYACVRRHSSIELPVSEVVKYEGKRFYA